MKPRTRFFNNFRFIFRLIGLDRLLPIFTAGKGYDSFFVKCIPQNFMYPRRSMRKVKRDGIFFQLDLSEYMEWVIYFNLNVEGRQGLYPLIKPGMVIFDVGSNIGETLMNFARLTGVNGHVYGFEPVPFNHAKCSKNLSFNNFGNITLEQLSLSNSNETLYFNVDAGYNSGSIFMNKKEVPDCQTCEAVLLDDYVRKKNISKIDFIKIDVEGFECNVLQGAVETCKKFKPGLFIEIDDRNLKRQGASVEQLYQWLDNLGYKVAWSGNFAEGANLHHDIYAVVPHRAS